LVLQALTGWEVWLADGNRDAYGKDNDIFPKIERNPEPKTMNLAGNGIVSEE
jgi:hypothetical protein